MPEADVVDKTSRCLEMQITGHLKSHLIEHSGEHEMLFVGILVSWAAFRLFLNVLHKMCSDIWAI